MISYTVTTRHCAVGIAALALHIYFAPPAQAEWGEWITDLDTALESHDNLNRSAFSDDEESDTVLVVDGALGRSWLFSDTDRLNLTGDLHGNFYDEFDDLNGWAWGATAKYLHKFGVGPDKPWLSVYAEYESWDLSADYWETDNFFYGFQLGVSFTPRWSAWFGVEQQDYKGENAPDAGGPSSDVFSEDLTQVSAETSFSLTQSLLLSLRLDVWDGQFHSACTPSNVSTVLSTESDNVRAIALDPDVFGGCVYSIDDGEGESAELRLDYAIGRHMGLQLSYQINEAEAEELEYDSSIITGSFAYRF